MMKFRSLCIGIDLDGTLVDYAAVFHRLAVEAGLVPQALATDKYAIRDHIRRNHGDKAWQALQAQAYGEQMVTARLFDGVPDTLRHWTEEGLSLKIVSHKSQYTTLLGENGPDLHYYALPCLRLWGVLDYIPQQNIFFCPTRKAKCLQISALGCDVFIDDLTEIFADKAFLDTVCSVLFSPTGYSGTHNVSAVCADWGQVCEYVAQLRG